MDIPDLTDKTAFITGTTRGIGKSIALALAEAGCNIVSTGKTVDDSESDLEGTIHKTAAACAEHGVETLAIQLDVRDPAAVEAAVEHTVDTFGGIDIVINNASAIQLANIADLPPKRFDLLTDVNIRGTFLVSRACIPHLQANEDGGWILTNAPPITVDRAPGLAPYAWSKLGMSFLTLSLAHELKSDGIGCNTFWPETAIDTRATRYFGLGTEDDWRTPEIVSDAVLSILTNDPAEYTGNALYVEDILRDAGVTDFSEYNVTAGDPAPMSKQMFELEGGF
ncbi:SDR family oxidoreductase [Natronocalculus amylovorans]|uniref:NAD(P)-dependent oxidoreductase n=1 Tax=Natronocalculus amylovorans TaxID=2917812 RepID=A0AAE3FYC9_9EURY|nr:NAD(P)-dependent oxidoreductase [Natronocalculus amylovorans]MCL9817561.1 NAD(P)-dependent oxidoreductase [Natronocalculus amylovorans]NUE02393.1 NAD(P)-dependent oxidoreductase [Halorubraceae archaeon YAN]